MRLPLGIPMAIGHVNVGISRHGVVRRVNLVSTSRRQKSIKPFMESGLMSKKNIWKEKIYEALKENALLTSEMPDVLANYRNTPSSVKIASVLCRDKRFRRLEKTYTLGLSGKKSHRVILFGRVDTEYESEYPYKAKRK
jgi:hypothetical protein